MEIMQTGAPPLTTVPQPAPDAALRDAAQRLEATFLAEMLKSTGLGKAREGFGGGQGEAQFSSLMVRAQAEQIARAGGVGLAEAFFHAMKEAADDN